MSIENGDAEWNTDYADLTDLHRFLNWIQTAPVEDKLLLYGIRGQTDDLYCPTYSSLDGLGIGAWF